MPINVRRDDDERWRQPVHSGPLLGAGRHRRSGSEDGSARRDRPELASRTGHRSHRRPRGRAEPPARCGDDVDLRLDAQRRRLRRHERAGLAGAPVARRCRGREALRLRSDLGRGGELRPRVPPRRVLCRGQRRHRCRPRSRGAPHLLAAGLRRGDGGGPATCAASARHPGSGAGRARPAGRSKGGPPLRTRRQLPGERDGTHADAHRSAAGPGRGPAHRRAASVALQRHPGRGGRTVASLPQNASTRRLRAAGRGPTGVRGRPRVRCRTTSAMSSCRRPGHASSSRTSTTGCRCSLSTGRGRCGRCAS